MWCTACFKQLTNGLDTFGQHNMPLCWDCFSEMNGENRSHYGLGPHEHDLSRTGSIIGSTVFTGEDDRFTPDPDAPGLGIWDMSAAKGWL